MSHGTGAREVAAVFGSKPVKLDPQWERDFAASLREKHSREELLDLFGRFRSGESAFDRMMRRVLVRAMAKSVGNDLQVEANDRAGRLLLALDTDGRRFSKA